MPTTRGTPPQFSLAKSHPGFGPIGPVAVTLDEFTDPASVRFESTLMSPDGGAEPLQAGNTADMIFPVDHLVAHLSRVCTLLPGDLIFTGTPEGVSPIQAGDTNDGDAFDPAVEWDGFAIDTFDGLG